MRALSRHQRRPSLRLGLAVAAAASLAAGGSVAVASQHTAQRPADDIAWMLTEHQQASPPDTFDVARNLHLGHTPEANCGPGSRPETSWQGRVPAKDFTSGRAAKGYTCNAALVSHYGTSGGYRVARYVDKHGHVCAFYDSTLLFPTDVPANNGAAGTYVLDMDNPRKPQLTANLTTPGMDTPHESLRLNTRRGLLVAESGSPATQLGIVDVYSVASDCRHPVLESTLPIGPLGHESGFSPDGKTFWATATARQGITAIDLTDPAMPQIIWHTEDYGSHGMAISPDGKRAYLAAPCCSYFTAISGYGPDSRTGGLIILDISKVQDRSIGVNDSVPEIGRITWPEISIPQNVIPVTIHGHKFLVEFDEFTSNVLQYNPQSSVGAVRIINIDDEHDPVLVSRIRLAVHNTKERESSQQNDPGAQTGTQGYAAHYCAVPRQHDPGILACSMILSGLRVFDIRDPRHPREAAYFNMPASGGAHAMSAPAFDPGRGDVWYSDGASGFWNVHLTNGAWPRHGSYPTPDF
jgi:hypothetical protein